MAICHEWIQPIDTCCTSDLDNVQQNGLTLVIYKIILDACGGQSCKPKTFTLRITGPSFPQGETFEIRAGSCISIDEPLIITGLAPGEYCIDELASPPERYVTTFTGTSVCGNRVRVLPCNSPVVVTIINRVRLCRLCRGHGCGCSFCSECNGGCVSSASIRGLSSRLGCGSSSSGCGCGSSSSGCGCGSSSSGCGCGCGCSRSNSSRRRCGCGC